MYGKVLNNFNNVTIIEFEIALSQFLTQIIKIASCLILFTT
jgi:hypothetical protein